MIDEEDKILLGEGAGRLEIGARACRKLVRASAFLGDCGETELVRTNILMDRRDRELGRARLSLSGEVLCGASLLFGRSYRTGGLCGGKSLRRHYEQWR